MRRRMSNKRPDAATVVRHYQPDLARQAQALLAVLRLREAHPPANEGTATVPERSNAPAGEPTGAQENTSAVTSGAANKQGAHDVTTKRP